jgi:hypothetical protein
MTKGERVYRGIESFGREIKVWTWTMDKEGATLKNVKGSKFLDKRSTQVGGPSS